MRVSQCVHALDPSICSCESVAYGKGTVPCLCHCTHLLFTGTSPSVCPWQPANLPNDADALPPCHLVLGMPHKAFRVHTQTNKNTTLHRSGFFHTFVIAPSHLSTIVLEALGLSIYIYVFHSFFSFAFTDTHMLMVAVWNRVRKNSIQTSGSHYSMLWNQATWHTASLSNTHSLLHNHWPFSATNVYTKQQKVCSQLSHYKKLPRTVLTVWPQHCWLSMRNLAIISSEILVSQGECSVYLCLLNHHYNVGIFNCRLPQRPTV